MSALDNLLQEHDPKGHGLDITLTQDELTALVEEILAEVEPEQMDCEECEELAGDLENARYDLRTEESEHTGTQDALADANEHIRELEAEVDSLREQVEWYVEQAV